MAVLGEDSPVSIVHSMILVAALHDTNAKKSPSPSGHTQVYINTTLIIQRHEKPKKLICAELTKTNKESNFIAFENNSDNNNIKN